MLVTTSVIITAVSIGVIFFLGFRAIINRQQEESIERQVYSEAGRLTLALRELNNDVHLLATLPLVQIIGEESRKSKSSERMEATKSQLSDVFTEMLRSKPYYAQIRLIGVADRGRELVRVNRDGDSLIRVPKGALQQKFDRTYFQSAIAMRPGQLFLSPINLNRERGKLTEPHQPMLRAAIRVDAGAQAPFGAVVINLDFGRFIEAQFSRSESKYSYFITNSSGDYLMHPNPKMTFGFDLGSPHLLYDEYPDLGVLYQSGVETAMTRVADPATDDSRLVHFRKVYLFPDNPDRFLCLGIAASHRDLSAGAMSISRNAMYATLVLVIAMLLVAIIATRLLARPLEKITLAAQSLARGDDVSQLPVGHSGEIGVLARTFDHMAMSLKRKEADLVDANERLIATNEDLEHFVHIAAHDLREPLRKQRNYADLLQLEFADNINNDAADCLDSISMCSTQMQEMIDAFRELTKLGFGNPVRQPTCMRTLIESCLSNVHSELIERNVSVTVEEFPDRFDAYPTLVRQLYKNLIRNALDHVPLNGFELHMTAKATSRGWIFGVRNTGSSIPDDQCSEVFQIFRKAEASRSDGRGVGLSICRKIVERHRGTISVSSTENTVTFEFTLGAPDDQARE